MQNSTKKENFVDLNTLFSDAWYEKVLTAVDIAVELNGNPLLSNDVLSRYIIDYNIARVIHEKILNNLVNTLPTVLDWTTINSATAFSELKNIVECCDICPIFKKHSLKIKTDEYDILEKNFKLWQILFTAEIPTLSLALYKNKTSYRLQITRL